MKAGRKTKYQPAYNKLVTKLCLLGATDEAIADFFEVDRSTISNWKNDYPSFYKAMKKGKTEADAEVAESLFKCSTGYEVTEVTKERQLVPKLNKNGEVVFENGEPVMVPELIETKNITKHIAANGRDALRWLTNRTRNWKEKTETEVTVTEVKQVFKIGDTEIEL